MADFIGDIIGGAVDVVGDVVSGAGDFLGPIATAGGAAMGMPWLGPVVTAGTSLLGASQTARTAGKAADAIAGATDAASATQWQMFQQSREDQLPWLQAGTKALPQLEQKIAAGPGKFTEDPGYQFRLSEGNKQIQRNASATGNLASGRTLKELTRYGQDYASNEYDKWLQRYYQSLPPLQSLAGVGQTTASGLGREGLLTGARVGQNTIAAGAARGSGYINKANAWTQGLQGGLNALGTIYGNKTPASGYWT